ncbi:hypothetical protein [Patulibacter sp.]|uniref:hypothetical protein n=1 Tax=Patulibacter sp. TaxID=1912859 RepID=UPI002715D8E8|nr:hypothetical protein [Patulibacter sp.]MDO9410205.1 hypothetical protein [Patulibacter sp.]
MDPTPTVAQANADRNGRRERGRRARWAPARDALWTLLDPLVRPGDRVAIVGAGNGDDVPLARIAARAATVALVDIDAATASRARGRVRRGLRRRIRVVEHDVTLGAADRVVAAARRGPSSDAAATGPVTPGGTAPPLPGGAYDLVVGDLLYSQLLYPAMLDAGVPQERRRLFLGAHGHEVSRAVVARLEASAPVVVHLHDRACWGNGYAQPHDLGDLLDVAGADLPAALDLAAGLKGPREADPRDALRALDVPVASTHLWAWPFVPGVDYLVVATVTGGAVPPGT